MLRGCPLSAAVQVSGLWATAQSIAQWHVIHSNADRLPARRDQDNTEARRVAALRNETEKMLRRYLYASMLVGRTPSILNNADRRGWASHHPTKTFEDAVIFVLDMENCLKELSWLERELLSRIVLQEYSLAEAASILRVSARRIAPRFETAVDELTRRLIRSGLLSLPH